MDEALQASYGHGFSARQRPRRLPAARGGRHHRAVELPVVPGHRPAGSSRPIERWFGAFTHSWQTIPTTPRSSTGASTPGCRATWTTPRPRARACCRCSSKASNVECRTASCSTSPMRCKSCRTRSSDRCCRWCLMTTSLRPSPMSMHAPPAGAVLLRV